MVKYETFIISFSVIYLMVFIILYCLFGEFILEYFVRKNKLMKIPSNLNIEKNNRYYRDLSKYINRIITDDGLHHIKY